MNESIGLGRFAGIRVGLNWSLLPIFLLLAWSLAGTLLPSAAPGFAGWSYWTFALLATAAFYGSLLAHELGHALVARRHGVRTNSIVLWLLGGVAQLEGDTPDPRAELEVAAAGPAVSFGLAAIGAAAAWLLGQLGVSALLVAAVAWLAGINVLLGLFNLLPAFPLDGGRILRAALWARWRDRARATAAAAKIGRLAGFGLIAVGAAELLLGGALNGIWLALIGWFVTVAAQQQAEPPVGPTAARELTVADAISGAPIVVPVSDTVADVIERCVLPTRLSAYPVVGPDGRFLGLATVRRMSDLPRASWATTPISAALAPPSQVLECSAQDCLVDVAARLDRFQDGLAIVVDGGRVIGVLSAADVARAVGGAESLRQSSASGARSASRGTRAGSVWGPTPQP